MPVTELQVVVDTRERYAYRFGDQQVTTVAAVPDVPPTAEVRAWARAVGMTVPDRGRLRPEILRAWREAH